MERRANRDRVRRGDHGGGAGGRKGVQRFLIASLVLVGVTPVMTRAQAAPILAHAPAIEACGYSDCALGIAPTWNGLAVVRALRGERVANLNFFWPRDISGALRGGDGSAPGVDSALYQARRAVRIRRIGATLTDAGVVMAAAGVIGAIGARHARRSDQIMSGAGIAALGLSVPFQFAADGALSRAVWWHNLRYGR